MIPQLTDDIYYDIANYIKHSHVCLRLCLTSKSIHQVLYPQIIRQDFSLYPGKESLWEALEDDNAAQLDRIYEIMYPGSRFHEYVTEKPNEFNFWLRYVTVEGGTNCLRLMLARAAESGFVPSIDTLNAAVEAHNREAVELLLEYGAPVTQQSEDIDGGPLFRARSIDMVDYLLAHGADPLDQFNGMNLLHWHCSQIWTSPLLITTLIEAGVPLDELDKQGSDDSLQRLTPLGHACANMNLPAIRTLLQHGANPHGASSEQKAERARDSRPGQQYKFTYPIESLMDQHIFSTENPGRGACLWDRHHISLLHEQQDDMQHIKEERDSILPIPALLVKLASEIRFYCHSEACYECGRGYFLADVDDSTDEAEKERQAGSLRFKSWASQMKRFAHRYFRGTQILFEKGGPELFHSSDYDLEVIWLRTFPVPLLRAGFCFSPYSGLVRDYLHESSAIHALIEGICQWDVVSTTCVQQFDYILDIISDGGSERGLPRLREALEPFARELVDLNIMDVVTSGAPIRVKLSLDRPFIGPPRRDPLPYWSGGYFIAFKRDRSRTPSI